jgi:putative membrane protein
MKILSGLVVLFVFGLMACNNSSINKSETTYTTVNRMGDTTNGVNNPGTSAAAVLNDTDRDFATKAGIANTAEIEVGQLAAQKGNDPGVKEFGSMMINEHGEAQAGLKTAVAGSGMSIADSVDQKHTALKTKLSGLSGKSFDREYIKAMVNGHKEVVALFENEISNGSHAGLKQFAQNTLPHIKMHLEKADSLSMKIK